MSDSRTFVIAEVGQAHDGSLGILHSFIDAVAQTGADAIKFQTHLADAESSPFEPFRVTFSYEDATRQDYWRRMEFTEDQWHEIRRHCEAVGLEFMSTPSSLAAVELLERVGVARYKVGSGDTDNRLLLHRIAATGKPMLLSTGLSTSDELDAAIQDLSRFNNSLVIMQCTTDYPVEPGRLGLNLIADLRARYQLPVGLSDHSGTIYPPLAAVALGASYIESHVVFDRRMFGPDAAASITIDEMKTMVSGIRMVEQSLSSGFTRGGTTELEVKRSMFGKTLTARRALRAGDVLSPRDLESTKPAGRGVPVKDYERVVGRALARPLAKGDFVRDEDLA